MDAQEIKDAVKEAIVESRGDFYIDPKDHFEDHGFLSGLKKGVNTVRKGSLTGLGIAIIGAIGWAIQSWVATNTPTP